jgi:hypothetical protein
VGDGEAARSACVDAAWPEGEGERDTIPEARLGLPIERKTVSSVRSIFLRDRVNISCFLNRVSK